MEFHKLSDQQLIRRFLEGDELGIEVLINRHKDRIYTYILMLVKDQELAEDIFQDTFIKVARSLSSGRYKDTGKFLSWTMRIAHNLVIDHFRKEKQKNEVGGDSYEGVVLNSKKYADGNIEDELVDNQIKSEVRSLVESLPDEQKEVILLRHYNDLSFKEIAEQTGVSINTALGRMRYALINMRKLIEEKDLSLTLD